jgi:soluble lytic murein transglycosylase-like protein
LRQRWLMIWHVGLIVVVLELVAYTLIGYEATGYQRGMWKKFNEQAYAIEDVDSKTPYAESINRHAREVGINGKMVASVIRAESSFQPRAHSTAGAYGLMQITPDTWRQVNQQREICAGRHAGECTVECYYDEELNIGIGTAYLGQLLNKYKGNMVLALAAYNAGPGAVDRYDGIPPYDETITYTNRVVAYWYELTNYPAAYSIFTAVQWAIIHTVIGWCSIITILGLIWVASRLHKYYHSWRWR